MKTPAFVRWCLALTLTGGALWGGNPPARALPEAEVAAILQGVPVFVLADNRNNLVLSSPPGSAAYQVRFHVSVATARADLQRLQRNDPEQRERVRVVPLPLSEAYRLARGQRVLPNSPSFAFVPDREQVAEAAELLQARGEARPVGDVPLFVATAADGSYLPVTLQPNRPPRVPFFFDYDQLEALLDRLRRENPEVAETVTVQVVALSSFIATLASSDDEALRLAYLFPSEDAIEFQRQQQR